MSLQQRTAMLGLWDRQFVREGHRDAGIFLLGQIPFSNDFIGSGSHLTKGKDCLKKEQQTDRSVTPSFVAASTSFCSKSLDKNKFKCFALIVGVSSRAFNLITSEL